MKKLLFIGCLLLALIMVTTPLSAAGGGGGGGGGAGGGGGGAGGGGQVGAAEELEVVPEQEVPGRAVAVLEPEQAVAAGLELALVRLQG